MPFINCSIGPSPSVGGEYLELVPTERLRYIDQIDDPHLPGKIIVTVTLKAFSCGTTHPI